MEHAVQQKQQFSKTAQLPNKTGDKNVKTKCDRNYTTAADE